MQRFLKSILFFQLPLVVVAALCFSSKLAFSQADTVPGMGPQMFFDAKHMGFTRDGKTQIFEGDVIAIGGGALLAADRVNLDRGKDVLDAEGHIVVLMGNQVFTGDTIIFQMESGDFKLTNAVMVTNDIAEADKVMLKVLGISRGELEFETARAKRLSKINAYKSEIRSDARGRVREGLDVDEDLVDRYAVLLEQEKLTKGQESPNLSRLTEQRRESLKRRRVYWQESRTRAVKTSKASKYQKMYFQISGDTIERTNGNDYKAKEAFWTPCRCEEDESPAWGFRSSKIFAQSEGYADLSHPVLVIKGIPVLYLPFLKVPLKERRQSGFLMPTFSYNTRSGSIYTQPIFFDLAEDADSTVTMDMFENRGTRLGVEYRFQQRKYSGWQMNIGLIRDRLWLIERGYREDLVNYYGLGLDEARNDPANSERMSSLPGDISDREWTRQALTLPDYWHSMELGSCLESDENADACHEEIQKHLAVPPNTWRGEYTWRGMTYFAPRLSVVSHGDVRSDHRYMEELYVADDFASALFGGRAAPAYSETKMRFHLDAKDFYIGLGARFGDNVRAEEKYQGQHIPFRLKLQSKMFSVFPKYQSFIPVFGQVSVEQMHITEVKAENEIEKEELVEEETTTLGDGNWRRTHFQTVSPVVTDRVVQVSHFFDAESRDIDHTGLDSNKSYIRSWKTGFVFSLPIDGKGELPEFMQEGDPELDGRRYIHHLMNWTTTFSVRPMVEKRGPYDNKFEDGGNLAYFSSDYGEGRSIAGIDGNIAEENRMKRHRRVSFGTSHRWKLFRRSWDIISAGDRAAVEKSLVPDSDKQSAEKPVQIKPAENSIERARRELLFSLDRPVTSDEEIVDPNNGEFLINRYQLTDKDFIEPVSLGASVAYDFLDAELRKEQEEENRRLDSEIASEPNATVREELESQKVDEQNLIQPWKEPNANLTVSHAGWALTTNVRYNLYEKVAKYVKFNLGLPGFWQTNVSFSLSLEKRLVEDYEFKRTRVKTVNLVTTLIPPFSSIISFAREYRDDYPERYESKLGLVYGSSSQCWGLSFLRTKRFVYEDERDADYLLQLSITFMGHTRSMPDMSPPVTRALPGDHKEKG